MTAKALNLVAGLRAAVSPAVAAARSTRRRLAAWAAPLLDFCYPGRCAVCQADTGAGPSPLCGECLGHLRDLEGAPACPACGMPVPQHGAPCPHCLGKGVAHYDRVLRLGTFHDPLKPLIHHIKYHGRWTLAEFLADRAHVQQRVVGILNQTDVLLPVPLHPLRQIARGFNQTDVIARRLAKHAHLKVVRPVVRLRNTETQTHMHSKAQRAENLRDAFALAKPSAVRGKHVVVIDDVRTTGATLHALAQVLRPAKPASLCAIVMAVADPKGQDFQSI